MDKGIESGTTTVMAIGFGTSIYNGIMMVITGAINAFLESTIILLVGIRTGAWTGSMDMGSNYLVYLGFLFLFFFSV